jgi:hypothetical protein
VIVLSHYYSTIRGLDSIHVVCVHAVGAEAFRSGLHSPRLGTLLWIESLPWLGFVRISLWMENVLLCGIIPCVGLHPFFGLLLVL